MPPRRRKGHDDEETVPAKKRCQLTEASVSNNAESSRSSRSKTASKASLAGLSPAEKLKKQLDLKEGLGVEGLDSVCRDGVQEEIKSKYFSGVNKVAVSPKKKETNRRNKLAPKKADSGKVEKLGSKNIFQSRTVGQARKGKRVQVTEPVSASKQVQVTEPVSASKGRREKEPNEGKEGEEEVVSKQKAQRKRASKSKASAGGHARSAGEAALKANRNARPLTVAHPKKKSNSTGKGGEGEEGGEGGERDEEPSADAGCSSSDSESEWEEVEELSRVNEEEEPWKSQLPDKPVQITLKASELMNKKRKKGSFDVKDYFRRQLNRFRTETQENAHKVHLLCLLSHGRFRNSVCCNVMLQSIAMSLIPPEFADRSCDTWVLHQLTMFTRWFRKTVILEENESAKMDVTEQLSDQLLCRFSERKAASEHEFILMFAISCRSIGLLTRLVYSLQPVTFKPTDLKKNKPVKNRSVQTKKDQSKKTISQESNAKSKSATDQNSWKIICSSSSASVNKNRNLSTNDDGQTEAGHSNAATQFQRSQSDANIEKEMTLSQTKESISKTKNRRPRRCGSKVNYDESADNIDLESEEDEWNEEMGDGSEVTSLETDSESERRDQGKRKRNRSSDDDFEASKVAFRLSTSSRKKVTKQERRRRHFKKVSGQNQILVEDQSLIKSKPVLGCTFGSDWWTEIYLEFEHKWICISGSQLQLNHPESVEHQATKPLSYVLAFDNDGGVKDVTKKYASDWLSSAKKIRLDESWWKNVLAPFQNADCERDVKEEAYVQEQLLKKPIPTSVSDFKNHSLYALKRHLLKYEAIYPTTAPVLGQIRGEPVYPRDCVHSLHSREKWLLEGRLVRIGEEPYKIVKARPKWNKPKEFNDRLKLPLYGHWQTEQFIPVPAVDGKIPKNEYGNVEVFKPWMIPGGTVYLPETMNGLGRVAKKLDVDIAPAMVGWDFHNGFNHPILQGWIVCEEHRDVLVDAWEEDQAIQQQKEAEKKQQRVLNNWKMLIRGLLIRERLKKRFDLQEPSVAKKPKAMDLDAEESEGEEAEVSEGTTKAMKEQALSWPENQTRKKEESGPSVDGKHNLFPFEKDHQSSSSAAAKL